MSLLNRSLAIVLIVVLAIGPVLARQTDQFTNVKLMVNTGDKPDETAAVLRLEADRIVVLSKESKRGQTELKAFPNDTIKAAQYSYSKHARWKSGTATAIAVGVFAIPVFFMKSKSHWLTIKANDDFMVLRLDGNNYKIVLPAFEARTGVVVERLADEQ
jgi:hypothetical protein